MISFSKPYFPRRKARERVLVVVQDRPAPGPPLKIGPKPPRPRSEATIARRRAGIPLQSGRTVATPSPS